MQPSMEACAWIHKAQDRSWRLYVMRTPDAAMRTSPSHVYYPWQAFFDGDFNRRRGLYIKAVLPKMPVFRPLNISGLTSGSAMCTATISQSRHTT